MRNGISIVVAGLLAVILLAGPRSGLHGQTASLSGVVLEEGTDRFLSGVTLTLLETGFEVVSDENGLFSFPEVPPGEIRVRVSLEGYVSVVESLTVLGGELGLVQLRLPAFAAALRELLVVGDRGTLGSEVSGSNDTEHATAADLLESQLPGLHLRRNMGTAGGGASVQLRGTNSLSLSNEAVIFVDGIRISPRMGDFGERSSVELHALEMIPAANVARIRILRGPAATARYPDTSNGVILVETVSGQGEGVDPPGGS